MLLASLLSGCVFQSLHTTPAAQEIPAEHPLQIGRLCSLDDRQFSHSVVKQGAQAPADFLASGSAGVYFLGPYDPARTPVLFIHGINGSPRDFHYLIERMDRRRFQPWVYYYPSGEVLAQTAEQLLAAIRSIEKRFRPERLIVVAYSMGGLVARDFVLHHARNGGPTDIPLLITVSTPWAGHRAALYGIKLALRAQPSWYDMVPGSEYLTRLFGGNAYAANVLPTTVQHHLIFSYANTAGDDVVSLASQLRPAAQAQACRVYGFEATHTGILQDVAVSALLNDLMAGAVEAERSQCHAAAALAGPMPLAGRRTNLM